jgi:uncharacterized membrane protein (UPF0127 family)
LSRIHRALVIVGALLVSAIAAPGSSAPLRTEPLEIVTSGGVRHFTVEIADTDATRESGLMFRKSMAPNKGMLFDFGSPQTVTFWMKNTLIPLDMIFIAKDGHVVSIARNAVPMSEALIPSGGPIVGVLELRGGRAAEIGVKPGDVVRDRIFQR